MALETKRILNTGLRVATLGTRFGFVFVLARFLDAESVGYYGLFTAAIGYALLGVGLDFYTFSTREILKAPSDRRGRMLKSQAALAGAFYLSLLPVAFVSLAQVDWPEHLAWWFLPILMLEHVNQEFYRLLIVLSEQITASLLLFVRQASWAVVGIVLMSWNANDRNLDTVMLLWACSGVAAAVLGAWKLKQLRLGGWGEPVDWKWLRKGVAVSITFLTATMALRGVQTVDRYWLQALAGIEVVGAYVLFFGIASALTAFLDASVFSFAYPEFISRSNKEEYNTLHLKVKKTLKITIAASLLFFAVSLAVLPFLLRWIGRPVYTTEMYLYFWIFAATFVNAVSMVPHYALYARGCDRVIVSSHIAALPAFALSTWILSSVYTAAAVPIGVFAACTLVLVWKTFAYLKVVRNDAGQQFSAQF